MGTVGDNQLAALSGYTGTIQDRIRKALYNAPDDTGTIDDLGGYLGRTSFWSSPADESSLVGWYQPSGLVGTPSITQWDDDSGEGNHLTVVTGTNPQATGSINSVTCARFSATNSIGCVVSYSQPMTVHIVAKSAFTTNTRYLFSAHSPYATDRRFGASSTGNWEVSFGATLGFVYARNTVPNIFSVVIDGATSKVYEDGVLLASGNVGTAGFQAFTLGGILNTFQCFDGDVAEAVMLNKVADAASLNRVGEYLGGLYGVTWNAVS